MSEKFRNIYRIPSARAPWWDYKNPGLYFITICTYGHECVFGKIMDGNMVLSPIGKIIEEEWYKSFEIRSELFCDSLVIMPNHIHAILRIGPPAPPVQTHGRASLPMPMRSPKSISSFVAGFKSAATTRINQHRGTPKMPVWQTRFYDHIIRDDGEFQRIDYYIRNNPENWKKDKFSVNK